MRRFIGLAGLAVAPFASANIVGHWDFDGNLNALVGNTATGVGNIGFEGTMIQGQAAQVARFGDDSGDGGASTSVGHNSYFTVSNGAGANGGGIRTNQYTILMDVFFETTTGYVSLYQTDAVPNGSDGDWFIRNSDNGLGISGDYTDGGNPLRFADGVWQRLALVIDTATPGTYTSYIDGVLQNVVGSPSEYGVDLRFSLGSALHMFADEDGETAEGLINSLQIRDYAMSAGEIADLGGASAAGIPGVVPEPASMTFLAIGTLALLRKRR